MIRIANRSPEVTAFATEFTIDVGHGLLHGFAIGDATYAPPRSRYNSDLTV